MHLLPFSLTAELFDPLGHGYCGSTGENTKIRYREVVLLGHHGKG